MKFYFQLQYKRLIRFLKEVGIHSILAALFFLGIFIILSQATINFSEYGTWIYISLSIALFTKVKNAELIKINFSRKNFQLLKVYEALLFSIPFVLFLLFSHHYLEALVLILLNCFFSLADIQIQSSFFLPTPFYKRPFEFAVGFRKTWFLLLPLCGICIIAMIVGNFNLGIIAIAFLYLTQLSYYLKPEDEVFIWMHNLSPSKFLLRKSMIAITYSVALQLPLIVAMFFVFPQDWVVILLVCIGGNILLILAILNKYSYFPHESELISGILIGLGILFPPVLPVIFIYLGNKATQNLKKYL